METQAGVEGRGCWHCCSVWAGVFCMVLCWWDCWSRVYFHWLLCLSAATSRHTSGVELIKLEILFFPFILFAIDHCIYTKFVILHKNWKTRPGKLVSVSHFSLHFRLCHAAVLQALFLLLRITCLWKKKTTRKTFFLKVSYFLAFECVNANIKYSYDTISQYLFEYGGWHWLKPVRDFHVESENLPWRLRICTTCTKLWFTGQNFSTQKDWYMFRDDWYSLSLKLSVADPSCKTCLTSFVSG